MLKATLAFGGALSETGLLRFADILCAESLPLAYAEWSIRDNYPPQTEGPRRAYYEAQLREAVLDGTTLVVTAWNSADDDGAFTELMADLAEYGLTWRLFVPGRVDPISGVWVEGSITVTGPGARVTGTCACGNSGAPLVVLTVDLSEPHEIAAQAALAMQLRHQALPALELV